MRTSRRRPGVSLLLGLACSLGLWVSSPADAACFTPLEWQRKPVNWDHDRNRNSIDDELEKFIQADPEQTFAVVLPLTRCAEPAELVFLDKFGTLVKRGRFVTFVALDGVRAADLPALAAHPLIAMIERMRGFGASLNVSGAAIKVRTSGTYPLNLESLSPTILGTGVTVAIVDSGVDDKAGPGTTHESLPASKWVGGWDVATNSLANVDDTNGHGTHVAGIAVGTGGLSGVNRGMAPGAGLVECKTTLSCGAPSWLDVIECFEQILLNQGAWGVDVVNLSLRQCDSGGTTITTNGNDTASQLANFLVSQGITVVAAAGNDGPGNVGLSSPCAADNAICVAAMNDQGTVTRTGDLIAGFSSVGPRANDGDLDLSDELKPDVSAPGDTILSAAHNTLASYVSFSGTSMASPHVAGLAALVLQAKPGINPGSLKSLIVSTAEDRGPAGWDPPNGHGYVDAYAAVSAAASAEPGYPNFGTYAQPWLCTDVTTGAPAQVGVPNTLYAWVRNSSANPANNVQVTFGVHIYSLGTPTYYSIGAVTVNVPPFTIVSLSHPWTPQPSPSGDPHACLKTTVNYGFDTNFGNNNCERNISVNQTNSPVSFRFEVQNTLLERARIELAPTPALRFPGELPGDERYRMLPGERIFVPSRWTHQITAGKLEMDPEDCPELVTLTLDLTDVDPRPVDGAIFDVAAQATTERGERTVLGGTTNYGYAACPQTWGADGDGDAVCGAIDNCPAIMNSEQLDGDGDGLGDVCDPEPEQARPEGDCKRTLKANDLFRAHHCLDKMAKDLSRRGASNTERILAGKVEAAQTALCRTRRADARARLDAFRHHADLLGALGALTSNQAAGLAGAAGECAAVIP